LTKNESVQAHRKKYENTGKHGNIGNTVNSSSTANNGIGGKIVNNIKPLNNEKISTHRCDFFDSWINKAVEKEKVLNINIYMYLYIYIYIYIHIYIQYICM
jgi:hypothetical protein